MTTIADMKYITDVSKLPQLTSDQKRSLQEVTRLFPFRSNDYYLSLINWDDPDDPIRKIIIPDAAELDEWGSSDPSDEKSYTVIPGLEHKYTSTVLLMLSSVCEGICRYCFRKRVFTEETREHELDMTAAVEYIERHTEITNVLLTGGDPLVRSTKYLEKIISRLRDIDHVRIIRIGTRMPIFNPYRIIEDKSLLEMIATHSLPDKKIYVITHFVHPRELTESAVRSIELLQNAGAVIANQTPLLKGINDNAKTLAELLKKLSYVGAIPYYIFQCRPAKGNRPYTVPIETAYDIIDKAKANISGLAKRIRYVLSHTTGKLEIIAKDSEHIYFKYHRAAETRNDCRLLIFKRNPQACWLDDYMKKPEDS